MTPYYVNLPLSWIRKAPKWLDIFAQHGLHPELGLDEMALGLPLSWHKKTAAQLEKLGMRRVSHLPFFLPGIGSANRAEFEAARSMLLRGAELAAIYGAQHMVGHPCFNPSNAKAGSDKNWPEPDERWLERSARLWKDVLAASPARLFLENTTHDLSPLPVLRLLERLPEGAAMCFDLGHWYAFAHGAERHNLEQWVAACAPRIGHLHLHDNHGNADEHLGIGQGSIPFEQLFPLLKLHHAHTSVTLEPHTMADYLHSAQWFTAHPDALTGIVEA